MPQEFQHPTDEHRRKAAGKGWAKSQFAQARFGKEPVTLPRAPWEAESNAEKEGDT